MSADESLVMRRSRRSTAGNRMEAVLAEVLDSQQDADEDVDFQFKDEEDIFESDFESTDEEDDKDVGEKSIKEEEKRVRKTARSKLDKATALAHARQKASFNPEAYDIPAEPKSTRKKNRGFVINPETGEVTETNHRKSQRMSTVLNRSATVSKIVKDVQEKKNVKRPKVKLRPPTQEELMTRALTMEEGNVIQHRDYLMIEEEKRKRARVVRATVEGPLMRWVSKAAEVIVKENPPPIPFQSPDPQNQYRDQPLDQATGPTQFVVNFQQNMQPSGSEPVQPPGLYESQIHQFQAPNPALLPPPERKERVEKNYVVVETQQSETAPLPTWKQTMEAMFGDHVKWDEVRVFTGKNRPLSRPKERCPITGLAANYCDPRTGVLYANAYAFKEITKVLQHQHVWSQELGCYVGREDEGVFEDDLESGKEGDAEVEDAMEV